MKNQVCYEQRSRHILHRVASTFCPYLWQCILMLLTICITQALGVVSPLLIGAIVDQALPYKNLRLLTLLVALGIVATIFAGLISIGRDYLKIIVGQSVVRDLRIQLYTHLQHVSLRFYTSTHAGDILSRFSNDCDGIQTVVTNTITTLITNIITSLTALIALFTLSWQLTLVSLCLIPLFLYPTYSMGKLRREMSKRVQETLSEANTHIEETLSISGILHVKSFGYQQDEIKHFTATNNKLMAMQVRLYIMSRWFYLIFHIFFSLAPSLVYYFGGRQVIGGTLTIGTLVAFAALQAYLFPPLSELLNLHLDLQSAFALFERIFAFQDLSVEISDRAEAKSLETVEGHISFNHVYFSYQHSSTAHSTLIDINFEIQPGQFIACVGPSGAGKTTISYLLTRLYDINNGSIKLDGNDIRNIQLASLSQHISVVTQETYVFNTTIRGNIRYGCPDATEAEIMIASKAAHIHERIMALPDGYDTITGTRGYMLSGGERQRIALARVILKNPHILILDEATSALDSQSERIILAALKDIRKDRTTLVITHRLSTVIDASMILVMDAGHIVERGTHSELLKQGYLYAKLFNELLYETDQVNRS